MERKIYNKSEKDELQKIAISILDGLRPKHLRIHEIRTILTMAYDLLEDTVIREK